MAFHRGPKTVTNGLILYLDAANVRSYPRAGTTWNDVSNSNNNSSLINGPTFINTNAGVISLDGTNDWVSIPGSTAIYTSNFTWQSFHYFKSGGDFLQGMWWSEAGGFGKNFLMAYANTDAGSTYIRIDTPSTVYYSTATGTLYNGFTSTAGPIVGKWVLTTIVKNGTSFSLYWNDAILMWNVTISNWSIPYTSQAIAFGSRNDNSFSSNMNISNILMYNIALSTNEIFQNYNALKSRFGL